MRECGHENKKECAWKNTPYHRDYPNEEQYGSCYGCKGLMNKGAYLGEQNIGDETWNKHHIDSNPTNNNCKNLVATHPNCNMRLG